MSPPYPLPRYQALSRGPWGDLGIIVVSSGGHLRFFRKPWALVVPSGRNPKGEADSSEPLGESRTGRRYCLDMTNRLRIRLGWCSGYMAGAAGRPPDYSTRLYIAGPDSPPA